MDKPKVVLVIDDNDQDRKIIKRFLSKAGYDNIIMAGTGEEGVEKAKDNKPDLVISDTMLPGIDGFEVCRQIRKNQGDADPKIIIITGSIDAVDAVEARKAGADDYCVKTSEPEHLVAAIKKVMS